MKWFKNITGALSVSLLLVLLAVVLAYPQAVTQISGLAVAQATNTWKHLKDISQGDAITNGVGLFSPCLWNGTSCDRQRGSIAGGALVQVTNFPTSGTAFFSVKRDNITTASVNLAFAFTSKKVAVRADPTNTAELCLDWLGGTAVCPAANTAGDGRLPPGTTILLDDYAVTSLSVIAASGTQIVFIDAWN